MTLLSTQRVCTHCRTTLPIGDFHKEKRGADGFQRWCKVCSNEYRRTAYATRPAWRVRCKRDRHRYYSKNPAKVIQRTRENEIKRKYGLTWDEYQALLILQDNRCALCSTETPGGQGSWHVDHNHETGDIRGLLCHRCNTSLGTWENFQKKLGADMLSRYLTSSAVKRNKSGGTARKR